MQQVIFRMGLAAALFLGAVQLPAQAQAEEGPEADPPVEVSTSVSQPVLKGLEEVPVVVAEVGGRAITRTEWMREMVGHSAVDALDRVIQRMLVDQAAKKAGVSPTLEELAIEVELDRKNLPNEMRMIQEPWEKLEQSFEEIIRARYQMSVDEYRDSIVRQRILTRKILGEGLQPSEEQLRRFFMTNVDLFQPQVRYRGAHILFSPLSRRNLELAYDVLNRRREMKKDRQAKGLSLKDSLPELAKLGAAWNRAEERAKECLGRLQRKEISWEQAVRSYSQEPNDEPARNNPRKFGELNNRLIKEGLQPLKGDDSIRDGLNRFLAKDRMPLMTAGELGWFDRNGPMAEEFFEAVKDMTPESGVHMVRSRFGWHLVKILELQGQARKTYLDVRDEVAEAWVGNQIAERSKVWLEKLRAEAELQSDTKLLWPPDPETSRAAIERDPVQDGDPAIGTVNGEPVLRSAVYRELLRSDGPDALTRMINREIALGPLQQYGPDLMEWLRTEPRMRARRRPMAQAIVITEEELQKHLNDDRIALDKMNEERRAVEPKAPTKTFKQYVYERFGQTLEKYKRSLKAGLILAEAVSRKIDLDRPTLYMEWALAKERYKRHVEFTCRHILIPVPSPEKAAAAEEQARDVRSQLIEKPDLWDQFAETFNMKGKDNLGTLRYEDNAHAALYRALANGNYEKDQISKPIRTPEGYHVVLVEKRRPERVPDFEEVSYQVKRDYLQTRGGMYLDQWMRSDDENYRVKRFIFDVEKLRAVKPVDHFPLPE